MTSQPQPTVRRAEKASVIGWWRWRSVEGYLFIAPWLVGFVAFVLGPFLASFFLSFADWNLVRPPEWVGLEHYRTMFTDDPKWVKSFLNTVYFTVFHVPLILVVALFTALLLNRQLPGIGVFRTLFYLPSVTAGGRHGHPVAFCFQLSIRSVQSSAGDAGHRGSQLAREYQVGDAGIYHHEHMGFRQLDGALSGRPAGRARASFTRQRRWMALPRGTNCSK